MLSTPIRIGTRRSKLALTQTGQVRAALGQALGLDPATWDQSLPLVEIVTTGDKVQDRRLLEVGGKALFTKEIEDALLDHRIDLAIHSMKDVETLQPDGLAIAAVPKRQDPRDAFLSPLCNRFSDLPQGARLGTASLRRQAQALALRPDLKIEMLRGNVDTRLRRLNDGDFDAILLATAGLNRLGLGDLVQESLSLDDFLPAPGQGALALQVRSNDVGQPWSTRLNDDDTALAVAAERAAMLALEGSCRTAVGAHATLSNGQLRLTAEILAPDGSARFRRQAAIAAGEGLEAVERMGRDLGQQVHDAAGDQEIPV